MRGLTPDPRIPRRIAAAYAVLAAATVAGAFAAHAVLERRERDGLREGIARAAREAASVLRRELAPAIEALPARAGDPYPPSIAGLFAEAIAVGPGGARIFPPPIDDRLPEDGGPGIEAVEEAERLAAAGREPEALEVLVAAARDSTAEVAWRALLATAGIFERSGKPERAIPYLARAAEVEGHPFLSSAARLRRAQVLERTGNPAAARAESLSVLEGLVGAAESWLGSDPAPIGPASVRLLLGKAIERLRGLGAEPPSEAAARIEGALADIAAVDGAARALAASPASSFFAVPGREAPRIAFRRRGGSEAFVLRHDAWEKKVAAACAEIRAGGMALAFRLEAGPSGSPRPPATLESNPVPIDPPLDGLAVTAVPSPGAVEEALGRFRLGVGLAIGSIAALVLAACGLGARNLARGARLARARAEFALSASHEIKTPLTVIRAAAETLAIRDLDADARRPYLKTLVVESRRLSGLVDRVLDLQRLEESPGDLERAPGDLAALAREAVESFRPLLEEAGFACDLEAPEPVEASVDAEAIVSALLAVLDNALRYTPPEAGPERRRIAVRARREGGCAVVEVADRGIGIPPEERERVFERYHRVRSDLFAKVRGAGLGLAIVREVLRRHGGDALVEANEPEGTIVRLWVPAED